MCLIRPTKNFGVLLVDRNRPNVFSEAIEDHFQQGLTSPRAGSEWSDSYPTSEEAS